MRCPVYRRRDSHSGRRAELGNLIGDVKEKRHKRMTREAESIDALLRGGLPRSSDEGPVMGLERRGRVTRARIGGPTGNRRSSLVRSGRRQPSMSGTSRISREAYVRFCEGLEVKFLGPTRRKRGVGLKAPSYRAHLRLYRGTE